MKTYLLILISLIYTHQAFAQSVTIYATNTTFGTGWVSSGTSGTKANGDMIINFPPLGATGRRGWAKFNLSTIPVNAIITSVTLNFYVYSTSFSTNNNSITGFTNDPISSPATTLYNIIGSSTVYNTSTWAPGWNSKLLSTSANSFVGSNIGGNITFGFLRGSGSTYQIYGYTSPAYSPYIVVNYTFPPPSDPTLVSSSSPAICLGSSATLSVSGSVGKTYWFTGNCDSLISSAIDTGVSISVTPTVTTTYYARNFQNGIWSLGCSSSSVVVNPIPTVIDPLNQVVCNNSTTAPTNFTSNLSIPGTIYSWVNNNSSIGLAPNGIGNIPSFIAQNTINTSIASTITVTPTANGCVGPPQSYSITVKPTPTVIDPPNQTVCSNFSTSPVIFSSNPLVQGTIYTWTNNIPAIGLPSSGVGDIGSFSTQNSTTAPLLSTVTVTPIAMGCTGQSQSFTITVNPKPSPVILTSSNPFCEGSTVAMQTQYNNLYNFQWYRNGVNVSGGSSFSIYNTSLPGEYTVLVTNSYGCSTLSTPLTLTTFELPPANLITNSSTTFCDGLSVLLTVAFNPNYFYQWYVSGNAISGSNINTLSASQSGSYYAELTDLTTNCSRFSDTSLVTVRPLPIVDAGQDQVVCLGDEVVLSGASPVPSYDVIATTVTPITTSGVTIAGPAGDDAVGGPYSIPFSFYFFGTPYTSFLISTNGFITFTEGQGSGCCTGQLLPNASAPNNLVAMCWEDLSTNNGGNIDWFVTGTAPNRVVVISWNNVPNFGGGGFVTGQIQLYETTNCVRVLVSSQTNPGQTNTLGIENAAGNLGYSPAGFNATSWTVNAGSPVGYSFCPQISEASNYTWTSNIINNLPFQPDTTSIYSVSTIDSFGCIGRDSVTVYVNYPSQGEIFTSSYGPFYLNGQLYDTSGVFTQLLTNQFGCDSLLTLNLNFIPTSLRDLHSIGLSIYPNPSDNGFFRIGNSSGIIIDKINILSIIGNTILTIDNNQNLIDLSSFESGLYLIEIYIVNKRYTIPIIKR